MTGPAGSTTDTSPPMATLIALGAAADVAGPVVGCTLVVDGAPVVDTLVVVGGLVVDCELVVDGTLVVVVFEPHETSTGRTITKMARIQRNFFILLFSFSTLLIE